MNTAVLLIDCPDAKGIVAEVSAFLYRHDANIIHADQHQDSLRNLFFMRVEWDLTDFDLPPDEFAAKFRPTAAKFSMRWTVDYQTRPPRVALFVSKYDHCLADVLYRRHAGELQCDIPLIVSNHPDAQRWAEFYDTPFVHVPTPNGDKEAFERRQLELLAANEIDLVVLARYMQILSDDFASRYANRIINVHHSFLPAFAGARPYHRAYERGVKLIGATSHYVTADLDEGPIIEQDVARVSHRDSIDDLLAKGRDLEKLVLARAVQWHITRRILLYGDKTVIFD
jgi:formyltetrahydrofolate deformylase